MKKVTLLWFGKTQDPAILDLILHYQKRLKPLLELTIIELKESKNSNQLTKLNEEMIAIEKHIPKGSHVFLMDERGKEFTSIKFSSKIEDLCTSGISHFTYIIGSAYGFHPDIDKKNYHKLALSKMTFTHDMVRIFLLEQVYRAEMIARNTGYHH